MMFPSPADLSSALQIDLGFLVSFVLLGMIFDRESLLGRLVLGLTTMAAIGTYVAWRWFDTLPAFDISPGSLWTYVFFLFEAVATAYTLLSILILLRWQDRGGEADDAQRQLETHGGWPGVDIFICSYNEPLEVLEKAILTALAIDYPDFTVYVLDDTRRGWLRDYCEEVGAQYLTRPDNKGAKAGNLNNGLKATAALSNAPLILVLDADFATFPNILRRTVGLFADPKTAVVQTPQFFYNPDPIQHNLSSSHAWVDDQRIFFDIFQPAKDAWRCAFCVGTSFVVRRDRLAEIGGFPDSAICEDLNLSYHLMPLGYETHWLNERLSVGLSAEGLPEFITQRTRWCLGTIQVALLRDGPIFGRGFTFMQRLHFVHSVMNWLCKPFIVLMLIGPALYWLFDLPAFHADYLSFLRYGVPALIALWTFGGWISNGRTLPLFMEVTHALPAPAVTLTLMSALIRPFGRPFKVTDKGGDRAKSVVRVKMALIFGGLSAITGGSIAWWFLSPYAPAEPSPTDLFNLVWAGVSMILTFVCFLICFERPRHEERFAMDEAAVLAEEGGSPFKGRLTGLSMRTAAIELDPSNAVEGGAAVFLKIDGVRLLPGRVLDLTERTIVVGFEPNADQRRQLILRIFPQPREHVASRANFRQAWTALVRRATRPA